VFAVCAGFSGAALAQQNGPLRAPTYNPKAYTKAPEPPRDDKFGAMFDRAEPPSPFPALDAPPAPAAKANVPPPRERQPLIHVPLDAFNDPLAPPRNNPDSSTARYSTGNSTSSFSTSQGSTMGLGTVPLYTTMPPRPPAPPPYGVGPPGNVPQPYR
jgi:hypothetical protein